MTMLDRLAGLFARPTPALPGPAADPALPRLQARQDSVLNPLTGLGGTGDKGAVGRPNPWVMPLSDAELDALYDHNGIARRIVDLPPSRATRRGWACPDIPAAEDKRLRTWERVCEAWTMADLYGGAVLLLVTEDDVPAQFRARPFDWLAQPLDLRRVGQLAALQVFDAWESSPMRWDTDLRSPTYRMPSSWSLSGPGVSATVHASRVVHMRGRRRPPSQMQRGRSNVMPDNSVLQAVWDEIRRLTETMAGGATLAQELRESVLKVSGLANKQVGDEAKALQARLSLMARTKALLGIMLIGEQDEYTNRSNPPTGFADLSDAAKSMLAGVTGIPEVVLFGAAPGGLNTDGDSGWEGFRQLVSDYQEVRRAGLEQLYTVAYAAQDGPTRGQVPDDWALAFAPLDEPGERDVAELRKLVADTDAIYLDRGVYGPESVATSRFGDSGWALDMEPVPVPDPDEDAAVDAARALLEQGDPKEDAEDGACCVLVPAADPGLRAQVEAAIGQPLVVRDEPHVTVLYLGVPSDTDEVVSVVAEEARLGNVDVLERGTLRTFPAGEHGTPVVVEFPAWPLEQLHTPLLRRLAHQISAPQHRQFRPHLTLGYAVVPLSPAASAALYAIDVSAVRLPVTQVQVTVDRKVVATTPVGT